MSYLLRVVLPDQPGSLGAVATALGRVEADILGVDVVEHRNDGSAVDDFLVDLPAGKLADSLVSACTSVPGVRVEFLGRYDAGAYLHRDLEAVEAMTDEPDHADELLVDLAPTVFRSDWAILAEHTPEGPVVRHSAPGAPQSLPAAPWLPLDGPRHLDTSQPWATGSWADIVAVAVPLESPERVVILGRNGGPDILPSELARLAHLAALAGTVQRMAEASRSTVGSGVGSGLGTPGDGGRGLGA